MTGPVADTEDAPLDLDAYRHHLLLLKSMHCARPVIHQGLQQFIKALTLNGSGGSIDMIVYLSGKRDGVDGREILIKPSNNNGASDGPETEN